VITNEHKLFQGIPTRTLDVDKHDARVCLKEKFKCETGWFAGHNVGVTALLERSRKCGTALDRSVDEEDAACLLVHRKDEGAKKMEPAGPETGRGSHAVVTKL
jgi:hypothetical protein